LPEQQSLASVQLSPVFPQTPAAQMPPRHASEQQSCARVHVTPLRLQYARQARFGVPGTGSHAPLQH
jgi:hypothetical protein